MTEQQYAVYSNRTGKLVGVSMNQEMANAATEIGTILGNTVRIVPVDDREAKRLREEQHKELMGSVI